MMTMTVTITVVLMWNRSCHRIVNLGQVRVLLAAISQKIQSTHLIINMMMMMMVMMIRLRPLFIEMMVMFDSGILVISHNQHHMFIMICQTPGPTEG